MQLARRINTTLFVGAFVPLFLLGSLQLAVTLRQTSDQVEDRTLARATSLQSRIDGQVMADLGSLAVIPHLAATGDQMAFRAAVQAVQADHPQWKNVVLTDPENRIDVWESGATGTGGPARAAAIEFAKSGSEAAVDGFAATPADCSCIALHRRVHFAGKDYVLTVDRDLADFQASLLEAVGTDEIGAIVDREARFIARTVDYPARRGGVATQFVQSAVARGGSGVYPGTTFEGLQNRTAYATSALSGWSTHIAVPVATFNLLNAGSFGISVMAVAVALAFAAVFALISARDLTARRQAERADIQRQKLEAMGHLSGTVAHDFNNLLGVIVACLRLLKRPEGEKSREQLIDEGLGAADRGAKLINQLLTFAKEKPLELESVDLATTIDGMRTLLDRSLGPAIKLDVKVSPRARYARTNAAHLELAILNLAVNARDAMPKGGTFSIQTRQSSFDRHIEVLVRDTGIGMTDEIAARALEPFFTTKGEQGTGLGLSQVNLLVHQSNGALFLDSAPGKGTLFTLRLPAGDQPGAAHGAAA